MDITNKDKTLQNICAIEIDAAGSYLPSAVGSLQPFTNTHIETQSAQAVHFGKGSVSFAQQGKMTPAGMLYAQALTLRFPNGDLLSAKRIQEYINVKMIYIKLSMGSFILMGRNDYFQNVPPKVAVKSTNKVASVTYSTTSIFPVGQTNGSGDHLLGEDFPINFYNI